MAELLFEVGTEEIPSSYLPKAVEEMKAILAAEFKSNRINYKEIKALATPRRLALVAIGVSTAQEKRIIEVIGPAKHIAFDEKGQPTRAALGFARGQGVAVEQLEVVKKEKGEYVGVRKVEEGAETFTLLPAILARLISSLSFPKSMRWMDLDIYFARPIHWILALFDGQIIPFQIGNISSGNLSRGHRFMAPGSFQVKDLGDYLRKLKNSFVIVNPEERKEMILTEATKAASEVSGSLLQDEELLETVNYLVEYPVAIRGNFAVEFLSLPREVLISVMREHQRYFPIVDAHGNLLPYFIAISNTKPKDFSMVARGNERVLRARLADARFFFAEDQKVSLNQRLEGLKKVVYHSKLGTSYEKVMRICQLADFLAEQIAPDLKEIIHKAALLCKGDLITGMVGEFPNLQGIMGGIYAKLAGEKEEVASAIYEHYLPQTAGGPLPKSPVGAILSIADKLDTIVGCFGVGLIPTGTADPYALRRQTIGIINIILDKNYPLSLSALIDRSLLLLGTKIERPPQTVKAEVLEFFKGRVQNILLMKELAPDVVEAALAAGFDDLVDLQARAQALHEFKKVPDFESLAIAFKRVVNISSGYRAEKVDPEKFEHPCEQTLFAAYQMRKVIAEEKISQKDYSQALRELAMLRQPVDEFFDGVLVMADNEVIRANRLALLANISQLFLRIGDFARIATN